MTPLDAELLLEQQDWMRRLARRLCADPGQADDLVQDAWVAALERPSGLRSLDSPRAWLATVARNLARQARRGAGRRAGRERDAARDEALPSIDDVSREMTVQREVTDALLALEEPYRTTLFLRFVRDRSFQEIARQEGVPLSTAHSRTKRGLELLRERLDRVHGGDRRAWVAALLPCARSGGLAPALGGLAMTTAVKISLAAAATLAGAAVLWYGTTGDDALESTPLAAATPAAPAGARTDAPTPAEPTARQPNGAREAVGAALAEPANAPESAPATRTALGRVLTTDGAPLARVEVGPVAAGAWRTTTDDLGHFAADLPEQGAGDTQDDRVVVRTPGWCTLVDGDAAAQDVVLVAAPITTVRGVVVDELGAPVEGARVSLEIDQSLFRSLGIQRAFTSIRDHARRETTTDAAGAFEIADACTGPDLSLHAVKPGFEAARRSLADGAVTAIEIVLPSEGGPFVEGVVVDADGGAVPGARVSLGGHIAESDPAGRFRLDAGDVDPSAVLRAVRPGHLPAERRFEPSLTEAPVVLALGGEPLSITGVVVDAAGSPVPGAIVWTTDPALLGFELHRQGDYAVAFQLSVEEALCGGLGDRGAKAGPDGRFELTGLVPRAYALRVLDPNTLRRSAEHTVAAGTSDARLVLGSDERVGPVRGRVVSASGAPLAHATIIPRRFVAESVYGLPPDSALGKAMVETDEDGRFGIAAVALDAVALTLSDDRLEPYVTFRVADQPDPEDMELVVGILCELQVVAADETGPAVAIRVLDADGEPLRLLESFGVFLGADEDAMLRGGRTSVLRVDERGRTLVVLDADDAELARLPIELAVEEPTTVRL